MYEVSVRDEFSAAHLLRDYQGGCEQLHGHNWKVSVTVRTKELNNIGMAVDFRRLKEQLSKVLQDLDHKYLNELPYFRELNPTSENIARYIYERLPGAKLRVTVWESGSSWASYSE